MIKVNELRIGNWIKKKGEIIKVKYKDFGSSELSLNPIPLTPEIWKKTLRAQVHNHADEYMATFSIQGYVFPLMQYPYVHQLQNLYFALTGEELKLEL